MFHCAPKVKTSLPKAAKVSNTKYSLPKDGTSFNSELHIIVLTDDQVTIQDINWGQLRLMCNFLATVFCMENFNFFKERDRTEVKYRGVVHKLR